jgi:hypothetical protein
MLRDDRPISTSPDSTHWDLPWARIVYTAEELAEYRERFKPVAREYRRRERARTGVIVAAIYFGMAAAVIGGLLRFHLAPWMLIATAVVITAAVVVFGPRWPRCPACCCYVMGEFGYYCPECGGGPLQPPDWWQSTWRCPRCKARLRWAGRGCKPKVRHCTHCGVRLDDAGL